VITSSRGERGVKVPNPRHVTINDLMQYVYNAGKRVGSVPREMVISLRSHFFPIRKDLGAGSGDLQEPDMLRGIILVN
jgi:hypothetical protein